jgi:hypothetical protein
MKRHLLLLNRIAGEMNAWLLVIAIGLGMLDLAVLVAKCIPAVTVPPASGMTDPGHGIVSPARPDNPRS